jgi:hypothetical protein
MVRNSKRRNPSGASGNKSSPRRGDKNKQTRVTPVKETDPKVVRQTKLSFVDSIMSKTASAPSTAITPDARSSARQLLLHPSPPTTPERHYNTNEDKKVTRYTVTEKGSSDSDNEKKPPAKTLFNDKTNKPRHANNDPNPNLNPTRTATHSNESNNKLDDMSQDTSHKKTQTKKTNKKTNRSRTNRRHNHISD